MTGFPARPAVERFWPKVDKDGPIPAHRPDLGPCWLWTAALDPKGYSRFRGDQGRTVFAHRFSYELRVGPIPKRRVLDHLCRVASCVNPAHLEPVTSTENLRRGVSVNLKTHCAQGHPWTPENISKHGRSRRCAVCHREDAARRWRERAA